MITAYALVQLSVRLLDATTGEDLSGKEVTEYLAPLNDMFDSWALDPL